MVDKTDELLKKIVESLRANHDVHAVWLAGSRGRGTADEFSDIDIWIALDDEAIVPVIADPLAFVHRIVPTVMHILAPSIAPVGGSFANTWVSVSDEFVQVDWYVVPMSTATRDADTVLVFGDVAAQDTKDLTKVSTDQAADNARDSLKDALQMVGNTVKHARRGNFWRSADHARHVDKCLLKAKSLFTTGAEPDFVAASASMLPEPPPTTAREVQDLALCLVDEIETIAVQLQADLDSAIAAMRSLIHNWRETGWKPSEEYYRSLPRRYMGAGMLFTDVHNNVLLLETTYKPLYEIPGGVAESGESPRETARREVQEELGLDIEPGPLLIFDTRSQPAPKGDAIMLVYDGGVIDDPALLHPDGNENRQVHFTPLHELDQFCTPQMATRIRAAIRAREVGRIIEIVDGQVID